jgi:carbonic anhydrase
MSIFTSASTWADQYTACGAPHQSPINLSRSFALPCDRLCELVIDKVSIPSATATIKSDVGFHLQFDSAKPTARFNGEGYTSSEAFLFTPAQHTIENIQAEAEFVVIMVNPKGYQLAISIPVRAASGETPSTSFFSSFVPYPAVPDEPMQVSLGTTWELQDAIPASPGFYVYEGTLVTPMCTPSVTWVVFANAITMDPSDYAKLMSRGVSGSRPLQPVGDREVFFNSGEKIEGPAASQDGKLYMRCRRVPREGEDAAAVSEQSKIKLGGLMAASAVATAQTKALITSNLKTNLSDGFNAIGGIWGFLAVAVLLFFTYFLFINTTGSDFSKGIFNNVIMWIPNYFHGLFFGQ